MVSFPCVNFWSDHELVTGGDDFALRRYDIRKIAPTDGAVGSLLGHSSPVTSLAICGDFVLSGAHDGSVRVWSDSLKHASSVKFAQDPIHPESDDTSTAVACLIGHSQAVKAVSARSGGAKKTIEVLSASSDTTMNKYSVLMNTK